jgi:hypothetical protein
MPKPVPSRIRSIPDSAVLGLPIRAVAALDQTFGSDLAAVPRV